ncbi:MAG TPA: transglutaminase domain-containing protein, partial [Cyclobacteriaceae bacterium]
AGDKNEILKWEIENEYARRPESYGLPWIEIVPSVLTRPNKFSIDNYSGSLESWETFGKWLWDLNKDLDELPEATTRKISELVSSIEDPVEKIRAVYDYVQSNTRYVSIQLGIGGWRPIAANLVDQMGYGDCKGLSNYTIALLKSIGIHANYVIIDSGWGEDPLIKDFPSSQFNHVIVCVPLKEDSVWLECTSQTNPFGYLGTFTGDRAALSITEQGGKIVHTVDYDQKLNQQNSFANVSIVASGNAIAKTKRFYHGLMYEKGGLDSYLNKNTTEQRKWLNENIDIPNFEIIKFNFQNKKELIPVAIEEMELRLQRYAPVSGKRIFFKPNLFTKRNIVRQQIRERKTDLLIRFGYVETDTIIFNLPKDYHPEFIPDPINLESEFGTYSFRVEIENSKLIYYRKASINKGRFSKEKYQDWIGFNKILADYDNMQIVLINRT